MLCWPWDAKVTLEETGRFSDCCNILSRGYSRVCAPPPLRGPLLHSLEEVLSEMCQSEVFDEGISCALFKLAEQGEVSSAQVLLRYGANLHFEGKVTNGSVSSAQLEERYAV